MIFLILGIFSSLFGQQLRKVTKHYRVNGSDAYVIDYEQQPRGTWTAFCRRHPHNPRSTNVVDCHLYPSGEICIAVGHEPRSLKQAIKIGVYWAHGYSNYIRTGVFRNNGGKINVPD